MAAGKTRTSSGKDCYATFRIGGKAVKSVFTFSKALDEMIAGGSPMSSSIARKVVASFVKMDREHAQIETLSDREKMVLDKLSEGLIGKEVADQLNISEGTVRKHIQNIYKKLQVNTRVEAINLYLRR